jgi:hypothetical protein
LEINVNQELIKIANLNESEIIKVAGILKKIKNWFKGWRDPSFKQALESLREKSLASQETITSLQTEIDLLNQSIESGDLSGYELHFNKVKDLAIKLIGNVKETQVTEDKIVQQKINQRKFHYYDQKDMESPDFTSKFKSRLPSNYDIELDKVYRKPLLSFEYYKNLNPDWIVFTEGGSRDRLIQKVEEKTGGKIADPNLLIENAKRAILSGELISAHIKSPSKQNKNQEFGSTEIMVASQPFSVPGSPYQLAGKFVLIDLSTALTGARKLSVFRTENLKIVRSAALQPLNKIAKEVPLQYTSLSDLDFAKVMKAGYLNVFGHEPSLPALAAGWAQGVLEAGQPIKLPGNNIGNIKAMGDWLKSKDYFVKSTKEFDTDGKEYAEHGTKWRAYATPEEGAAAYWQFLKDHQSMAVDLMDQGKPMEAAVALGKNHYYSAPIEKYSGAMATRYQEFLDKIAPQLPPYNKDVAADIKPSNDTSEINQLMNKLVASPLTNLVKKSMQKHQFLVRFSNNYIFDVEFANKLAFYLQKYAEANTQINSDNNVVELQIKLAGDTRYNTNLINHIIDLLSTEFSKNYNFKVEAMTVPNYNSELEKISMYDVLQNHKSFIKFAGIYHG